MAQSCFHDHGVRPDPHKQFPLGYNFAGPLRENGKNVQCSAREFHDRSAARKPTQTRCELELAETQAGSTSWWVSHRGRRGAKISTRVPILPPSRAADVIDQRWRSEAPPAAQLELRGVRPLPLPA